MQKFKFKAVDAAGRNFNGEAAAQSVQLLLGQLRDRGMTVLDVQAVQEAKPKAEQGKGLRLEIEFGVSRKAVALFTRQLATTLHAGLSLLRIVHVLRRRNSSKGMRRILGEVAQDLQQGLRFSEALAKHKAVFDETYLNMVRVGEAGGSLPETVARLAMMLEKEEALRRKIRSAMTYPMFILLFSLAMSYVMVAFMMPLFIPMFEDSGLDIPKDYPLTDFLMKASQLATSPKAMAIALVSFVVLVALFRLFLRLPVGRFTVDWLRYHLPPFRALIQQGATARFSRTFSLLLQSGVPLLQALSLVGASAGNAVVERSITRVARNIQEGDRISDTLEQVRIFPDLMIQMAAIGEEAGSLPEMFERVAEYYEAEIDATVAAMTALLEPAMMVLVGGVVGVFVMGILLPILGVSTGYQNQM